MLSSLGVAPCNQLDAVCMNKTQIVKKMGVEFEIRGLVAPVYTPMNEDFSINYNVIPQYVKFLSKNNIIGILVNGTAGEGASLTQDERKAVAEAWIKAAKPLGVKVIVQIGGTCFFNVLELAKHAESLSAEGILTLPELYFKPESIEALVSYMEQIGKAAPKTPLLYYHNPAVTNVTLSMPDFITAAQEKVPTFKGVKFTANDLGEGGDALAAGRGDHTVFLGNGKLLAPAFTYGFDSSIGATFSAWPKLGNDIVNAVRANDIIKAQKLQKQLSAFITTLKLLGSWVPIMKFATALITGIQVGPPRPPLKPIPQNQVENVTRRLKEQGLWPN